MTRPPPARGAPGYPGTGRRGGAGRRPARRRRPSFMHVFVEASLRQDEAYTVDDRSSACLWFPPGWEMSEAESASFEQAVRAAAGEYAESGPLTIVGLMER